MLTLCVAFAHPIEKKARIEYQADKQRKHPQKFNQTFALAI